MKLIDTHAHLDEDAFSPDLDDVLARAAAEGLSAIITIGTTAESSSRAVELAGRFPNIYAAVGIQPNYVAEAKPGDFETIEQLAAEPKVVAVGETGLDRYWDYAPFDLQVEHFARHVELAQRRDLPFVVHCREADDDVVSELTKQAAGGPLKGIMHSFCGNLETLRACLDLGLHISFAGMLTYKKNDGLRRVAAAVPLDRLLIETDSPYLAPVPKRGKRNEPAYVRHTAECLAEQHGLTPAQLAERTTENARALFGLPGE